MTAGCLSLILILLLRSEAQSQQKSAAALFTTCVLAYLFVDWEPMLQYNGFYFFLVLAIALPYVFWVFSESLFNDAFRLRYWMLTLLLGYLLVQVSFFFIAHGTWNGKWDKFREVLPIFQPTLPFLFVVLGIVAAFRGRADDLIAARFQFRNYFILLTASLIILTLFSEIAFYGEEAPMALELLQKVFIAGLTFFFAGHQLLFQPGFFLIPNTPPPPSILKPEIDKAILKKLNDLMDQQQHWRTEGLTIRQLAQTMQIKEYKLRNTINQQLGFRNFNDFLHAYRIKEACKLLSNPEKKEMTILEIAYEMGYSSISPFNKAFKQITEMTPTAWRKAKMS